MRWFVGATLVLLLALTFRLGLMAYAMYCLLGVMIASRLLSQTWIRTLSATRQCNRLQAEVGDEVAVVIEVENTGTLPVPWVLMEDILPTRALIHEPPNLRVKGSRLQLAMVQRRKKVHLLYQLQCNRRGYYQIGPLVLETGDLFGLHRRYRVSAAPSFLLVWPKVIPLQGFDIASRRPIGEVRMSHRLYEDPTRIAGVRQYQAGDPLNRVHWRATARTGVLHSKIYEPSTVAGATVVVDFHIATHDKKDEPFRSELAVTAAASVANAVYELGQQVGLITNGRDAADRIRREGWEHDMRTRQAARRSASMEDTSDRLQPIIVPTRRGPAQLTRILESLARLELSDGLQLPELVTETSSRMPRDATVMVILPTVTTEIAIALQNVVRRGFAVTAIINLYDEYDFADASGPLLSAGIDTHHLKDEAHIVTICQQLVTR